MKKSELLAFTFALLTTFFAQAQNELYPKTNNKVEEVSSEFPFESKFLEVDGNKIHYIEQGKGEPVVFLHGIPTWSYLWRNVVPEVGNGKRAIALDFLGYGKSDYPANNAVTFHDQYKMLDGFLSQITDEKVTLVVNDLGSMVGLSWAMNNQDKLKGIVIIEGVYMPSVEWYNQLTGNQKMMVHMMRKEKNAEKFLVKRNVGAKVMPKMFTQRKLSKEEKEMYKMPFEDEQRRYVMVYGPGPANFLNKNGSQQKGDLNDIVDQTAIKLAATQRPILLIYAKKGLIVREEAVEYARSNFKNYSEHYLGKGKHFLPESYPKAISTAINNWHTNL